MKEIVKILPRHRTPIVKKRNSKKKTNEEYLNEVAIKHPNIEVVDRYIDAKTKIVHKCLIDNYEWLAKPNNVLSGKGCPKCSGTMKKTHLEYVEQLVSQNIDVEVLEKYINAKAKILHLCKKHNIEWHTSPSNILQGKGCPECLKEKIAIKNGYTHEQYVKKLKNQERNIEIIGTYINAHTSILFKCLIDGYEWMGIPSNILLGQGCPKCARNIKRTHEQYVQEMFLVNPHIEVLEEYINSNFPILHRCKNHNVEWKSSPINVLKGYGCAKCGNEKIGEKLRKSQEQYVEEVLCVNPDICVIGTYVNLQTPILHKCLIDGYVWDATPDNILYGNCGCPQCKETSGERKIRQWLEAHNIKYDFQKRFEECKDKNTLPFDFYLPQYNVCIEYQGGQHYFAVAHFGGEEKFKLQKKHDDIKRRYCEMNNIKLLEIPYFKNVEEELNNFLFI